MKWVHNDLACQQCNILLQRRGCAGRLAGCSLNLNNIQMGSIHSHCCCWLHVPKNSNAHPLFKPFHALLFQKRKRGMPQLQLVTVFQKKSFGSKKVLGERLYLLQTGYERRPFGICSLCDWIQQKSTVVVVNIQTSFSTVKAFFLLLFPPNSNMLGWLDIDKKCNAIIESCKLAKALKYLSSFSYFLCKIRVNFHFIFCKTQPSLAIW